MPKVEHQDATVLTDDEVRTLDAHWRAANYLAAGQIYLMANVLIREMGHQRRLVALFH